MWDLIAKKNILIKNLTFILDLLCHFTVIYIYAVVNLAFSMRTNRQRRINDLVLLILLLSLGYAIIYATFSENLFLVGIVSLICSALIAFTVNIINSLIPQNHSIGKILRTFSLTLASKRIRIVITVILLLILLEAILSLQNDPEIMMYVIDNSGSMGCYSEALSEENKPKLDEDGNCREKSAKLETAKNWIKNDFSNKKKYRKIGLIEIGGFTSANRQNDNDNDNCKIEPRITLGISNYNKLTKELDNIKANASGATDIVKAIVDASKQLKDEPDIYTKNIAVISDLEHNCKSNIDDITKQLEKELNYKPEIVDDFVEKNVTVY
ncbi:MAG: VWA domain-containing protein, partial [Cyanobacteria bacterium P01_F01_bin.143]